MYFKFTQSSHAVIFCTAVFVLPVSSHVVISRAFQGPPFEGERPQHDIIKSPLSSSYPTSSTSSPLLPLQIRPPNRLKLGSQNNHGYSDGSPPSLSPLLYSFLVFFHVSFPVFTYFPLSCFLKIVSSLCLFLPLQTALCRETELKGNFVSPSPLFSCQTLHIDTRGLGSVQRGDIRTFI